MSCCPPRRSSSAPPSSRVLEQKPPLHSRGTGERAAGEMVRLDGGAFLMGTDDPDGFPADGEGPIHSVTLSPFWIDVTTVTNRQFGLFVDDTAYETEAERFGWSYVFAGHLAPKALRKARGRAASAPWWFAVDGAFWRRPEGRGSHVGNRQDHPVVHVSWNDARAYAAWAGKRLPTEAEWESAARGGLLQKRFPWGDELEPGGEHRCNVWQGVFPTRNTAADGFTGTAPVQSFPPNGRGLYEVAGNVWEWCARRVRRGGLPLPPRPRPHRPAGRDARDAGGGRTSATPRTATAIGWPPGTTTRLTARRGTPASAARATSSAESRGLVS